MLHNNLSINAEGHLTLAGVDTVKMAEKYGLKHLASLPLDPAFLAECDKNGIVSALGKSLEFLEASASMTDI